MKSLAMLVLVAAPAGADDEVWQDPQLRSGVGISTVLGLGVTGFTDAAMRDAASDVGGLWNLRVTFGSHTPLGVELGYLGTSASIERMDATQDATLLGTALELSVRYNFCHHARWNPYASVGLGFQRHDIVDGDVTLATAGMNDADTSLVFPLAAGLTMRDTSGFVIDVRGVFRPHVDQNLVFATERGTYASLQSWEASVAFGYEL